jgi:hypothetical protein
LTGDVCFQETAMRFSTADMGRKAAVLVKRRFGQANHGGRTRIEISEAELVSNSYLSSSQHGNNVSGATVLRPKLSS